MEKNQKHSGRFWVSSSVNVCAWVLDWRRDHERQFVTWKQSLPFHKMVVVTGGAAKICSKKKQLGDRGQRKRNNLFWTISNKLVTTVPGDTSCLSPPRWHAWASTHTHTHAGTRTCTCAPRHTTVWVCVKGIVCTPQTVTSRKPS